MLPVVALDPWIACITSSACLAMVSFARCVRPFSIAITARHLQELRMREACRLLAETTRPIHEIVHAVGFADELYFSRRFHLEHGLPPARYRKTYALRTLTGRASGGRSAALREPP